VVKHKLLSMGSRGLNSLPNASNAMANYQVSELVCTVPRQQWWGGVMTTVFAYGLYTHYLPSQPGQISPKKASISPNAPDPPPIKHRVKDPTANAKKANMACKFPSVGLGQFLLRSIHPCNSYIVSKRGSQSLFISLPHCVISLPICSAQPAPSCLPSS